MSNIKYVSPIDKLHKLITALDTVQRETYGINYSVRGQFISIYLPIEPMIELINNLAQNGYLKDDRTPRDRAVEQGYSPTDTYFNFGPYTLRIAQYKDKLTNTHDLNWLHAKYSKEVSDLKDQLNVATHLLESTNEKYLVLLNKKIKKSKK